MVAKTINISSTNFRTVKIEGTISQTPTAMGKGKEPG